VVGSHLEDLERRDGAVFAVRIELVAGLYAGGQLASVYLDDEARVA
jgi:hypothetical protein